MSYQISVLPSGYFNLAETTVCVSSSFSVHFPFPALSSTVISFLLLSGVLLISSACPSQASNNQCQCTNRFMRLDCKLFSWGLRNFFFSWPCVIYFLCKQIFHPICVVPCPKGWIWMLLWLLPSDSFLLTFRYSWESPCKMKCLGLSRTWLSLRCFIP